MTNDQIKEALSSKALMTIIDDINFKLRTAGRKSRMTYYQLRLLKNNPANAAGWARDAISDYFEGNLDSE